MSSELEKLELCVKLGNSLWNLIDNYSSQVSLNFENYKVEYPALEQWHNYSVSNFTPEQVKVLTDFMRIAFTDGFATLLSFIDGDLKLPELPEGVSLATDGMKINGSLVESFYSSDRYVQKFVNQNNHTSD